MDVYLGSVLFSLPFSSLFVLALRNDARLKRNQGFLFDVLGEDGQITMKRMARRAAMLLLIVVSLWACEAAAARPPSPLSFDGSRTSHTGPPRSIPNRSRRLLTGSVDVPFLRVAINSRYDPSLLDTAAASSLELHLNSVFGTPIQVFFSLTRLVVLSGVPE